MTPPPPGTERPGTARWRALPARVQVLVDHYGPRGALLLPLLVGAVVMLVSASVYVELADDVVDRDGLTRIDQPVLDTLAEARTEQLTGAARVVTTVGSPPAALGLAAAAGLVLSRRRRTWAPLLTLGAAWLGAATIGTVTKLTVGRARPDVEGAVADVSAHGNAFPSGHASISLATFAAVALVATARSSLPARVAGAAVALAAAAAVGLSRPYLGVHWPTDVVASWALALAWVAAVLTAVPAWEVARSWRAARVERGRAP